MSKKRVRNFVLIPKLFAKSVRTAVFVEQDIVQLESRDLAARFSKVRNNAIFLLGLLAVSMKQFTSFLPLRGGLRADCEKFVIHSSRKWTVSVRVQTVRFDERGVKWGSEGS